MNNQYPASLEKMISHVTGGRERIVALDVRREELAREIAPLADELEGATLSLQEAKDSADALTKSAQNEAFVYLSNGSRNDLLEGEQALEYVDTLLKLNGVTDEVRNSSITTLGRIVIPSADAEPVPSATCDLYNPSSSIRSGRYQDSLSLAGIHVDNHRYGSSLSISNPYAGGIGVNYSTNQGGVQFSTEDLAWKMRTQPGVDKITGQRADLFISDDPEAIAAHRDRSLIIAVGADAVAAALKEGDGSSGADAVRFLLSQFGEGQVGSVVFPEDIARQYPQILKSAISNSSPVMTARERIPVQLAAAFAKPILASGALVEAAADGVMANAAHFSSGQRYIDHAVAISEYERVIEEGGLSDDVLQYAISTGAKEVVGQAIRDAVVSSPVKIDEVSKNVKIVFAEAMLDRALQQGGLFRYISKEVRGLKRYYAEA